MSWMSFKTNIDYFAQTKVLTENKQMNGKAGCNL